MPELSTSTSNATAYPRARSNEYQHSHNLFRSQHPRRCRAPCKGIQRAHSTRCNRQRNAPYPTAPEYVGETAPYLNQIAILATQLSHDELAERTKRYQAEIRANNPYAPLVNIDIDIVEWNGTIMRPADARAAYYLQGLAMLR